MKNILQSMPLVTALTVQPPGRPSFVVVIRPLPDLYLATDPKDDRQKWFLSAQSYEDGGIVGIPVEDITDNASMRILGVEEVERHIDSVNAARLEQARRHAEETLRSLGIPEAQATEPSASPPSPASEPAAPGSSTGEAPPTPPG